MKSTTMQIMLLKDHSVGSIVLPIVWVFVMVNGSANVADTPYILPKVYQDQNAFKLVLGCGIFSLHLMSP